MQLDAFITTIPSRLNETRDLKLEGDGHRRQYRYEHTYYTKRDEGPEEHKLQNKHQADGVVPLYKHG